MLDLVAAQLKVQQIARLKTSCRRSERIVQEPAPSRPIPGSMASAALLAYILVSKFDNHPPLYRLAGFFTRMGADIPDSTLVGWCGRAMKVLQPLIERIEADAGAETLSRTMTIIETAKMNDLDPQTNLAEILSRIHDHKINRLDELFCRGTGHPWQNLRSKPHNQLR